MRFIQVVMPTLIVLWALGPSGAASQGTSSPAAVEITYEEFMKLDPSSRRARFERANAETRATIMRTHAERWLAANRARLTSSQVDLVQQVIALVTPALYRNPTDPDLKKQLDALEANSGAVCAIPISSRRSSRAGIRSPPVGSRTCSTGGVSVCWSG